LESLLVNLTLPLADGTESVTSLEKKITGYLFRQPGYLFPSETRGFPPPPCDGFGFLLGFYDKHILIIFVKVLL
jgi:hypothetical protein